jgi:hypothetical protein
VSQLRKFIHDPFQPIAIEQIDLQPDLTYQPDPVRIVGRDFKALRNKRIPIVKVEWAQPPDGEYTWELESDMMTSYPHLFRGKFLNFEDGISLRGVGCNNPISIYQVNSK